jgi:protein SCO1/2
LTNETLRGNLVIYSFIDTSCTDNCTDANATLEQLQAAIGDFKINDIPLRFVTISLDPAHDTPETLRAYAQQVGAMTPQWHFVSSDPEQFSNLRQAESQDKSIVPEAETAAPLFVLVDGWGIVRALYATATPDIDQVKRDLDLVAQEARQSNGVNRYGYEAVHLFMCHNGL